MRRDFFQELKIGAHRGYVFSYLNDFFFRDGPEAPCFRQVSHLTWIDPHDAGAGGIHRWQIAPHYQDAGWLRVSMIGQSPSMPTVESKKTWQGRLHPRSYLPIFSI
jgi:hypothetical protein